MRTCWKLKFSGPHESEIQDMEARNQWVSPPGDSNAPWSLRTAVLILLAYIRLNKVHLSKTVRIIYSHILLISFWYIFNMLKSKCSNWASNSFLSHMLLLLCFQQNQRIHTRRSLNIILIILDNSEAQRIIRF